MKVKQRLLQTYKSQKELINSQSALQEMLKEACQAEGQ